MHLANLKKSVSRSADRPTLKAHFSSPSNILPIWKHWTGSNKALSFEERQWTLAAASTASSKKLEWWCYCRYLSWLKEVSYKKKPELGSQESESVVLLDFLS